MKRARNRPAPTGSLKGMRLSRRSVLGAGLAAAATSAIGIPAVVMGREKQRKPKNIIFIAFDGMAVQVPTMADQLQFLNEGKRGYWRTLMGEPYAVNGLQDTGSLNSVVTDSAAASAAWASGRRQWNGQLNMYPDGTKLRPIVPIMHEAGVRTALVTTTRMTHATPAAWAVNSPDRNLEGQIAEGMIASGVDIMLGGGSNFFDPQYRNDRKDAYALAEQAGFKVVKTRDEVMNLRAPKILGIFARSHLPYTVDHINSAELKQTVPTLAELTKVALDNLKGSPNGFVMQIEAGRVDHGGHANDLAGLVFDQIAGEEAVRTAVEWALNDGETLVIITADHACGGPSLNGAGSSYGDSNAGLQTLNGMKASYEVLLPLIAANPTADKIRDTIKEHLSLEIKPEEAAVIEAATKNQSPFRASSFFGGTGATTAMILGNYTKVTWTSGNHTSDHVLVTAVGPGAEQCKRVTNNVEFFDMMLAAKDLKYENPKMTFEEARRARAASRGTDPELLALYGAHDDDCDCHHGAA